MSTRRSDIRHVRALRVWDSRGFPTVEAEVELSGGTVGRAIAPAGASRGSREVMDRRDGDAYLGGRDVRNAVASVENDIAEALRGMDVTDQQKIDDRLVSLDGTDNLARLGGNAVVAVSLACLHASAALRMLPLWRHVADICGTEPLLPLPEIQIFGGGAHANRRVDIQDFMIMAPGASHFAEALDLTAAVYYAAGEIMKERGQAGGVADEGGWWPQFDSNEEVLDTLVASIERAGEIPGDRIVISLDVAASEFASGDGYRLALDDRYRDRDGMISMLSSWIDRYPVVSVEDPLVETDRDGMVRFTQSHGEQVQIVGDDYLVTDPDLVRQAVTDGACNAVLVKVNQIGTVSAAIETCLGAARAGWGAIVSARSGETEDLSICHLATGLGMGQLKVGSFSRSERMAKWNECLRIERTAGLDFAAGGPLKNTWWNQH